MLQLKNIVKTYTAGELTQNALNGVSVTFRKNEFVSILGPSGSGKTTMLNIPAYKKGKNVADCICRFDWYYRHRPDSFYFYRNSGICE